MSRLSMLTSAPSIVATLVVLAACGAPGSALDSDGSTAAAESDGPPAVSQESASEPAGAPGDQPGTGGRATDPCGLLEDAEIEEHAGWAVLERESAFDGQCQWTIDNGGAALPTIFVEVMSPGGRERWEILASQMPAVEVEGGEAYRQGDSIWAVKGDTMVELIWFVGDVDQMIPLVEAALTRIQE